jgi:hypothetical protein
MVAIKEAYETAGFGQNAAQVRHDLEDVLEQVHRAGYRPVLVLDDTEKFVSPGLDGKLDEDSVENLYYHGSGGSANCPSTSWSLCTHASKTSTTSPRS